jgi:hypothetical protein
MSRAKQAENFRKYYEFQLLKQTENKRLVLPNGACHSVYLRKYHLRQQKILYLNQGASSIEPRTK